MMRGPDAEYLTFDEFRKLFGVPEEWLESKIADGTLPRPVILSARTKLFSWEHAVFLSLWMKFHGAGQIDKK